MTRGLPSPLRWANVAFWFAFMALLPTLTVAQFNTTYLRLEGDSITIEGTGAAALNGMVTISAPGIYSISGSLNDGQIRVEAGSDDKIVLELNGVNISSSTSAPIFVVNADKTTIRLIGSTENRISDAQVYTVLEEDGDEPNAAIFSKDDLDIEGEGTLIVEANYNHGIASNDDLKIKGGNLVVYAVNDGLKGKDSVEVRQGVSITVVAGGDGMQSHQDHDPDKGFVLIEEGTSLEITAQEDGIQAATSVTILGGDITIMTAGGSAQNKSEDTAKGIKADLDITIEEGTIHIDAADDAIHSDEHVTIHGGTLVLATTDDAIRGNSSVTINGGDINITQSYEGLEGDVVTINGGTIHISSSDDGISVGSQPAFGPPPGMNMSAFFGPGGGPPPNGPPGRPGGGGGQGPPNGPSMFGGDGQRPPCPPMGMLRNGRPPINASDEYLLSINGGYLYIDSGSSGDGIDSNGHINITGGTVLLNGPTTQFNGAFDTDGQLKVSGGFALGVGSAGMAQSPGSATSTQLSVRHVFDKVHPGGTTIHLESKESGMVMFTFVPAKEFQSFVFSSPDLVMGETYDVFVGGSVEGPTKDGLCQDGCTYDGQQGRHVGSLTIKSMVTNESDGFDSIPSLMFPGCNFTDLEEAAEGTAPSSPLDNGSTTQAERSQSSGPVEEADLTEVFSSGRCSRFGIALILAALPLVLLF